MPRLLRLIPCGGIAAALLVAAIPSAGAPDASGAVFLLQVVRHTAGVYQPVVFGTAFFIDGAGTALTNSHVVYLAHRYPERYSLLAVVGREFYSASVICASRLRADPAAPDGNVPPSRDVAKIFVRPAAFPFRIWRLARPGGERLLDASAHQGPLPRFGALAVAGTPAVGGAVHVIGFAHLLPGGPRWAATGRVLSVERTPDGTEIFGITFTGSAAAGNSGAPVLDAGERVVGMWTWNSVTDANLGMAISSSAFRLPCLRPASGLGGRGRRVSG